MLFVVLVDPGAAVGAEFVDAAWYHLLDVTQEDDWQSAFVAARTRFGVEHSGVIDAHFGATLVFRDPENIQLELFVHPDAADHESLIATDPTAS